MLVTLTMRKVYHNHITYTSIHNYYTSVMIHHRGAKQQTDLSLYKAGFVSR